MAIEQDALHQGKLLQEELTRLVNSVKTMRRSIQEVARVAQEEVEESLAQRVVVVGGGAMMKDAAESVMVNSEDAATAEDEKEDTMTEYWRRENDVFDEEEKLAALLADAFQERQEANERFTSISEFLDKFDVSASDSRLLDHYDFEDAMEEHAGVGGTSGDGMDFLQALDRVSKIRRELQTTFEGGSSSSSTTMTTTSSKLGISSTMRMMDSLSTKQERAFERLYRFLHSRLDLASSNVSHVPTSSSSQASPPQPVLMMDDEDGMDETLGNEFIRRSLVLLRQVPAYYSHTLELIATRRRSEVTRKFLLALTSGYNGGTPMERMAHDPLNYVGDMLAFVFRMLNVESVIAKGLAVEEVGSSSPVDPTDHGLDGLDGTAGLSATDVLNDILSGVSRPLKSRISQVIRSLARRQEEEESNSGLIHGSGVGMDDEASAARVRLASLYSISGLLLFYQSAMTKAVNKMSHSGSSANVSTISQPTKNPLVQCILDCLEEAARAYSTSIKMYSAVLEQLASFSNKSTSSLAQQIICRLCDVRGASPGFGPDMAFALESAPEDVSAALSLEYLCDTFLETVVKSFTKFNDIMSTRMALLTTKKAGIKPECYSKWEGIVAQKEQTMIEDQIKRDTNLVLDECGLGTIANNIESMKAVFIEGMTMSSHPGLLPGNVKEAMSTFYQSLFDPPLPSYENIRDPTLRKYARSKVAQNVGEMYKEIYDALSSEAGGYNDLSFLEHTPDQVKRLFSS